MTSSNLDEILISLDEWVSCPTEPEHRFQLRHGLAEATVGRIRDYHSQQSAQRAAALREQLEGELARQLATERDGIRRLARAEEAERAALRERDLREQTEALRRTLESLQGELSARRQSEWDLGQKLRQTEAERALAIQQAVHEAAYQARLEAVNQTELALNQRHGAELEILRLKQAELEKQRDDAHRAAEELKRRMEQGSQQTQGEALELALERDLPVQFPSDQLAAVEKGVHGADLLHTVLTGDGRVCGSITWETKNTLHWNAAWIEKLRQDVIGNRSEFGVLVSSRLPDGIRHFGQVDGIWVCDLVTWPALASILRQQVLSLAFARASADGRDRKMNVLYGYLTGPEFRERVNAIIQMFLEMREQLDKERRAFNKHWSAREKQITTVIDSLSGMYGDLQGIIGKASLPEIPTLELEAEEVEGGKELGVGS